MRKAMPARSLTKKPRTMQLEGLEARHALTIAGLGVAGDSWSDEYAGETYSYSQNWVELLRTQRGVDVGTTLSTPPADPSFEPRRTGTSFNWARTGALTIDLLIQAQDIEIADQFTAGDVSHAVLLVGNTDFEPGSEAYTNIYNGTWSASEIDNHVILTSTNIEAAIATLASVPTKALVATIPDPGLTPQGKSAFPDATKRALVTNVINMVNTRIKEAAARYHTPVVDLAALSTILLGTNTSPAASRTIGGRVFDVAGGTAKTNLFVQGGVLPHVVYQAHVANAIIEGLNFAYNENLSKFTEQQIVILAGQTYGGTDTFPINYRNLIIVPPVTLFLDYGQTSTPNDDFTARLSELATARGIPQIQTGAPGATTEMTTLKANIITKLQTAFAGTTVNFTASRPGDTRYESIKLGRLSSSVPGPLTSVLGQSTFDWLNASEISTGFVFPDLISFNLSSLTRAEQLRYLENILTFYIAQETGRGMGLTSSDAYSYPQITSANYANTAGVQFQDFMSGDTALGFSLGTFNGTPAFRFSPLGLAKLQLGHWVTNPSLVSVAETGSAHDTTATAQVVTPSTTATAGFGIVNIKGASISTGSQKDLYRINAAVGDLITAQTFATGVYPGAVDTVVKLFASDGTTLLIQSDDTLLGNNSIGQTGTTNVDSDSLIMNFVAPTAGSYFIEVTAKSSATGNYDLLVGSKGSSNFPWQNPANPLNVNNSTGTPLITAFDALLIINELNLPLIMNPVTFVLPVPAGSIAPPPYLDVNADNKCTAFDALQVINFLNLNPIGGPEFVPMSGGEAIEDGAAKSSSPIIPGASGSTSSSQSRSLLSRNANSPRYYTAAEYSPELLLLNTLLSSSHDSSTDDCAAHEGEEANDLALQELLADAP